MLCRLDLNIPDEILQNVVRCKPGIIEYVLYHLMCRVRSVQQSRLVHGSLQSSLPPNLQIETLQQQQSSMSSVSQIVGPYGGTIPAGYIPSETYLHNEQVTTGCSTDAFDHCSSYPLGCHKASCGVCHRRHELCSGLPLASHCVQDPARAPQKGPKTLSSPPPQVPYGFSS